MILRPPRSSFPVPLPPISVYKTGKPPEEVAVKLLLLIIVIGAAGLVAVGWLVGSEPWLWPHRWALTAAFDGQINPSQDAEYRFVCAGFECQDLLPRLPSVSSVRCAQRMFEDDLRRYGFDVHIQGSGACCLVTFEQLGTTEVHIYWTGSRYEILLTEPRMREIANALAKRSPSG